MRAIAVFLVAVGVQFATETPAKQEPKADAGLWAAISVNQPLFTEGHLQGEPKLPRIQGEELPLLMIHFVIVNDGKKTVDPELGSSQLLINGKELKEWSFVVSNGPRDARFEALPPGDNLEFGYAMGKFFDKPGIYKVSWKGKSFQASEIVFRVLPKGKE